MTKKILLAATLVASVPATQAAFTDNLSVYYTFDAGTVSGTVVTDQYTGDSSTDNVTGSALTTAAGKFGNALTPTTDAATPMSTGTSTTINSVFLAGTSDYTLSFWYKQATTSGTNQIIGAGARANDGNNDDGLMLQ